MTGFEHDCLPGKLSLPNIKLGPHHSSKDMAEKNILMFKGNINSKMQNTIKSRKGVTLYHMG